MAKNRQAAPVTKALSHEEKNMRKQFSDLKPDAPAKFAGYKAVGDNTAGYSELDDLVRLE